MVTNEQTGGACDAAPSFAEVCTSCHDSSLGFGARNGAPLSYDFDQYETARSEAAEIQLAVEEGYAATRLLALRGAEGGADRVGGVWCPRVTAARAIGVIPWADGSQGAHAIQH